MKDNWLYVFIVVILLVSAICVGFFYYNNRI